MTQWTAGEECRRAFGCTAPDWRNQLPSGPGTSKLPPLATTGPLSVSAGHNSDFILHCGSPGCFPGGGERGRI